MSTLASLTKIREQRATLIDQLEDVAAQPRDVDTATRELLRSIVRLTDEGEQILRAESHPVGYHGNVRDPQNAIGLLFALLGREQVESMVRERMRPFSSDGISPKVRADSIAELQTKLKALEEAEEIEILRLEAAGHTVARRDDADVAVLLRLWEKRAVA